MNKKLSYFGVILGAIAVAIALFQDDLRPESSPVEVVVQEQSSDKSLKEKVMGQAIDAGKRALSEKLFGDKVQVNVKAAPDRVIESGRDQIDYIYLSLGLLAVILGFFGWANKEHYRVASAAVGLGIIAISWSYVMIAVVVLIVLYVLYLLLSSTIL